MNKTTPADACPLHGAGLAPQALIGRRLTKVVAAWHWQDPDQRSGPVDVWLIDDGEGCVRITTGSDWCLIVEASEPYGGYDMGGLGRVTVEQDAAETPLADIIGYRVLHAQEDFEPLTGRIALDLTFPTGRVRCESHAGELRLRRLP
ncbi:hypothetical protein [Glycomyces sp. NPDC048151]|uniref:hypothetical protein n=1 Tax=Glycomyces sp. NPDC048151 TaxID=3364002 RepID=UPI00372249F4